jgi:hypothetical protein
MDWEVSLITGVFTVAAFVALQAIQVSWHLLERLFPRVTPPPQVNKSPLQGVHPACSSAIRSQLRG